MPNKYIDEDGNVDKDQIWWDAWNITDPGAANPVAVAGTLAAASGALLRDGLGTDDLRKHPALRVMAGQLASLYNVDSAGPSDHDLNVTRDRHHGQQKARQTDVCTVCNAWGGNPCRTRPYGRVAGSDHHSRPATIERDYSIYEGDSDAG